MLVKLICSVSKFVGKLLENYFNSFCFAKVIIMLEHSLARFYKLEVKYRTPQHKRWCINSFVNVTHFWKIERSVILRAECIFFALLEVKKKISVLPECYMYYFVEGKDFIFPYSSEIAADK